MSTIHHPVCHFLLVGILAITALAFIISRSGPAPSGITNRQVENLPLQKLNELLGDIATELALKNRKSGGDVIHVSFDYSYLLTQSQWEMVAQRAVEAITSSNGQEFFGASHLAQHIEQYLHNNKHLAGSFKFQEIIDASITRLHDPDISIVRQAGYMAGVFPSMVPTKVDIKQLLILAESAPSPTHKELILRCISSVRFSQSQPPSVDAKIVAAARSALEDPNASRKQRMEALGSIKNATGAAHDAAKLAAEQYNNLPDDDQRMALFVLTQLVSIYDNPDAESRRIATEIAMPIFIQAAQSNDLSIQMSAAGVAQHLYSDGEPLVPALIAMLDHPDFNVSGMAISALGNIGPQARDAIPHLHAMIETSGDLEGSIRDTLYLIAKEGPEPSWYGKFEASLKETGVEID